MLAGSLELGEPVRLLDGRTAVVAATRVVPGAAAMWDLAVSQVHTFAVGAGGYVVHNCNSNEVDFSDNKQLQKKYKHASDFGVEGTYNAAKSEEFKEAMKAHLDDPDTVEIEGTYKGNQPATHYYNPRTDLNVIADSGGRFVSGWRLGENQVWRLLMLRDLV